MHTFIWVSNLHLDILQNIFILNVNLMKLFINKVWLLNVFKRYYEN